MWHFVYLYYFLFMYFLRLFIFLFFFFNDTATTEIYTLSLHDALPISRRFRHHAAECGSARAPHASAFAGSNCHKARCCLVCRDRKSTRLNSSHLVISYAVFCLKKKKKMYTTLTLMSID